MPLHKPSPIPDRPNADAPADCDTVAPGGLHFSSARLPTLSHQPYTPSPVSSYEKPLVASPLWNLPGRPPWSLLAAPKYAQCAMIETNGWP
jgi:hypothetical protein